MAPGTGLSNLGLDLAYTRITDAIVRHQDQTSPLLLHSWPRNGQQSCMWKWFFERPTLMRDSACPLLPAVQMFEHGHRSFLVTAARPCSTRHLSDNMRRRLERVRDVIHAMAWLHQHNVSLNYIHRYQYPFLSLYAQPASHQQTKRGPPGKPEPYSFTEQLPERPPRLSPNLPWCATSANDDPRVAGPRNVSLSQVRRILLPATPADVWCARVTFSFYTIFSMQAPTMTSASRIQWVGRRTTGSARRDVKAIVFISIR